MKDNTNTTSWALPLQLQMVALDATPAYSVKSRQINDNCNPEWNQFLELPLRSGQTGLDGVYKNAAAPFHVLLGKIYDKDLFGSDPMGYFQVPLAILMDGNKHEVECTVLDGEGTVELALQYLS
mmetsp:Transcript_22786/g.35691  ORF Transcript_22786/g.35691 Transcript_22786/m.35691 type:complete len:124 (+) Transcript_22786:1090-1461(+)